MIRPLVRYFGWMLLCASMFSSCAFFARKPPLPRQASVERLPQPATETDFSAQVENADIIYFPTERAASGGRSEPAALLLEALEKRAQPFAIGWDMIETSQQLLLDQLEVTKDKREELIAQLDLAANGRAREHCRAVLRETPATPVQYLALRGSRQLLGKIGIGDRLSSDEERLLPRGYKVVSGNAGYSGRTELVATELVAEAIVRSFRSMGSGTKLLVFASGPSLEGENSLPSLVAQKLNLRQLIFAPNTGKRPTLMTQDQVVHIKVASKS